MSQRYNISVVIPKKDGGTFWHRIGSGFASDSGAINCNLNSLPVGQWSEQYGYQVRFTLFVDEGQQKGAPQQQAPELNDDIPF